MAKTNQRIAISKYMLKEALLRLLAKKHIDKISICELCQEAQINRTTFYRHYNTPQDVLHEIALDQIRNFFEGSLSANDTNDMEQAARKLCHFLYDHITMVQLLIRNSSETDFAQLFQTFSEGFLGSKTVFYRGNSVDTDTLRLMNTFFSYGMYALISQWLTENIAKTPDEIADLICSAFNKDFSFQ